MINSFIKESIHEVFKTYECGYKYFPMKDNLFNNI